MRFLVRFERKVNGEQLKVHYLHTDDEGTARIAARSLCDTEGNLVVTVWQGANQVMWRSA
jgi:hypothetical protein